MKGKIFVLVLMWASMLIFLPAESRAADASGATASSAEYNPFLQNGRGRGRGRGRGWDDDDRRRGSRRWDDNDRRRDNRSWNRNNSRAVRSRGFRLVRQTFWRNGRRHTRTVRVY
jgi:hypothetical protein